MKIKVLCNSIQSGEIYAVKGETVTVPNELGKLFLSMKDKKGKPKVEEVK